MEDPRNNIELPKAFLNRGIQDLKSAKILQDKGQYPDVCYHCQQCAEKSIKALLILTGKFLKQHTVSGVFQEVIEDLEVKEEKRDELEEALEYSTALEEHWNIPRYPMLKEEELLDPLQTYSMEDGKEALN